MVNLSPTEESYFESLCSLRFAKQVNQCELGKPKRQLRDAPGGATAAVVVEEEVYEEVPEGASSTPAPPTPSHASSSSSSSSSSSAAVSIAPTPASTRKSYRLFHGSDSNTNVIL